MYFDTNKYISAEYFLKTLKNEPELLNSSVCVCVCVCVYTCAIGCIYTVYTEGLDYEQATFKRISQAKISKAKNVYYLFAFKY